MREHLMHSQYTLQLCQTCSSFSQMFWATCTYVHPKVFGIKHKYTHMYVLLIFNVLQSWAVTSCLVLSSTYTQLLCSLSQAELLCDCDVYIFSEVGASQMAEACRLHSSQIPPWNVNEIRLTFRAGIWELCNLHNLSVVHFAVIHKQSVMRKTQ